ncbi:MAG TPA: TlpA disulfide reductase family protein [Candidatus Acidoferrum sp.]|nr:TlpA disulfide reductase family protein [Candidatus Acidoferrum sp.]
MTNLVEGQRAPEFTLKAVEGKEHSLTSMLSSGPVVAAFFKVSCPVCQFTLPFLQRLHQQFGASDAAIVGISQDSARDTRAFNQEYGVKFLTLIDEPPYPVSNAYGLTNVPTIFLIEQDRTIKVSSMGFGKSDLEKIAAELALWKKLPPAPFFRSDEIVPAYKPG